MSSYLFGSGLLLEPELVSQASLYGELQQVGIELRALSGYDVVEVALHVDAEVLAYGDVQAQTYAAVECPAVVIVGILHVGQIGGGGILGTASSLPCIVGSETHHIVEVHGVVVLLAEDGAQVQQQVGAAGQVVVFVVAVFRIVQIIHARLVPKTVEVEACTYLRDEP